MESKILQNQENIKKLIASIINKQIGKKLKNLELKNDSDIKEINQISKLSKELTKNLHTFSSKINKKISEQKNQRKIINNQTNIRSFSPSNLSLKRGKNKKNIIYNHHNINNNINNNNNTFLKNNLMRKKSQTPLKTSSNIMKKNNVRYKRDIKILSKSIDISRKRKIIDNEDNQSKYSHFTYKKKVKTPVRKKNKNYINKLYKTPENTTKKNEKIDFDLTSLDNDIEITKISINYDENKDRISNELFNLKNTRLTIRLGALAEKIEKEKLLIDDDIIFPKTCDDFLEIIEIIFDNLFSFLDIRSFFNIIMVNKTYFNFIIKLLIGKLEIKNISINQYLTELKSKNKSLNLKEEKIKSFEYNNSSIRALSILNSITVENFFSEKKINFEDKNIKIIFDLYFIVIGKKKDVITCNYKNGFREKFIMNYFKNSNKKIFGNVIDDEVKQIKFTDEIINSLYEYSYDKLNIISPKIFQRINKNITWFCYLIKNLLEYLGILNKDSKDDKNIKQIYNVFCSRLHINEELIKNLKKMQDLY